MNDKTPPQDEARACKPVATAVEQDGRIKFTLSGDWLDYSACPRWDDCLPEKQLPASGELLITAPELGRWNSALIAFALNLCNACRANNISYSWQQFPPGAARLLELALAVPDKQRQRHDAGKSTLIHLLGQHGLEHFRSTLRAISFLGTIAEACFLFALGQTRTRWRDIALQVAKCGHQAMVIVSLMAFLIGVILAFIGSIPLEMFGADIYIATLIGIGILRMMAATTVGTVMAGRTGAAFAAELGSMNANEELDAYVAMGLSPIHILVLPRFLALTFTMPLLCIYADLLGILGGVAVGVLYCDIGLQAFLQHLGNTTRLNDLGVGIFTAWIFGMLIAACGCYHGITCGRNSTAVGKAATAAVVSSIVCMVLATAIITLLTVLVGI